MSEERRLQKIRLNRMRSFEHNQGERMRNARYLQDKLGLKIL